MWAYVRAGGKVSCSKPALVERQWRLGWRSQRRGRAKPKQVVGATTAGHDASENVAAESENGLESREALDSEAGLADELADEQGEEYEGRPCRKH